MVTDTQDIFYHNMHFLLILLSVFLLTTIGNTNFTFWTFQFSPITMDISHLKILSLWIKF